MGRPPGRPILISNRPGSNSCSQHPLNKAFVRVPPRVPLPDPSPPVGLRPVRGSDDRDLRDLLRDPRRSGAARLRPARHSRVHQARGPYLGTDRPLYVQYGKFFGRLMPFSINGGPHFKEPSLGRSFTNRQTVNSVVLNAAPVTASLVFGGAIFWMMIALPVGILSALRPRSLLDRIAMVFVLVGISAHPVWIGLI